LITNTIDFRFKKAYLELHFYLTFAHKIYKNYNLLLMKKIYFLFVFVLLLGLQAIKAQGPIYFEAYINGSCGAYTISFNNMSDLSGTTGTPVFEWYIDGNLYSTDQYPMEAEIPPGNHNIDLFVNDDNGYYGEDHKNVTAPGFSGAFYTEPAEICPNEPVSFHINENHDWLVWKFPNGDIKTYNGADFIFGAEGEFPVTLTVKTECGIETVTQNINISNTAKPEAQIEYSNNYVCPNDELYFSTREVFNSEWLIEGVTYNGKEIFYAFNTPGTYHVILTNYNSCGGFNKDTVEIVVADDIPADAYFDVNYNNGPCPGAEINFYAHASGTFDWDFGDGSVGFGKTITNTYVEPGEYTVIAHATNGCGSQDIDTNFVSIFYDTGSWVPEADFQFDIEDGQDIDTLVVCPNEEVRFKNTTYEEDGMTFMWDIDGTWYYEKDISHIFTSEGEYMITLIAQNRCMSQTMRSKTVIVNPNLMPGSQLSIAPAELCPGENVYFFDDRRKDDESNIIYRINFGDGNFSGEITEPVDDKLEVLAIHNYPDIGTYNYMFTATNTCMNTDTVEGQIIVANDPNKVPFYYFENSTEYNSGDDIVNWNSPPDKPHHKFHVNVDLTDWNNNGPMDSTIIVFFWYGEVDTTNERHPDGYIEMQAPGIATAYIPFDVVKPSVGVGAAWYCNKGDFDEMPQVYSYVYDRVTTDLILSYPIAPQGETTLTDSLTLNGFDYVGFCPPSQNQLTDRWYYQTSDGYYNILDIYEEYENLRYNLFQGPDPWSWNGTLLSWGGLYLMNDTTIEFMPEDTVCLPSSQSYLYFNTGDELQFTDYFGDNCSARIAILTSGTFMRQSEQYDHDNDRTGCPNDLVEFRIVGGTSYEWHINNDLISTEAFVTYAYADTGTYEEYVIATNSCGRIDTLYTKVRIDTTNVPSPYWNASKYSAKRFEEIQFIYNSGDDDLNNNSYFWDFGDGTTSIEKNPFHTYEMEGEYKITLEVTNGCGTASSSQYIYIKKQTASCEAKFVYTESNDTVYFQNTSFGAISDFYWEFGDGTFSTKENPVHKYPADGVYEVIFTIFDSTTNCSDQIYKQIMVGIVNCNASFNYTVNATNNTVSFNNLSTGDISEFWWDFGDGNFSNVQNPIHTYTYPGVYWVCLSTFDGATQCMSDICKEVVVGDIEIYADFDYYIDPGTGNVNFLDISQGTVTNWYWEFGDGAFDTLPETMHHYNISGEYIVCLMVYNATTGAFDDNCKPIYVATDTNDLALQAKYTYVVMGDSVGFMDKTIGKADSWYWTFGDGTYATGQNVSHTYPAPGIYTVCLIVFDSATGFSSEICKDIQVGTLTCNINASFSYYINPTTKEVSFTDKSTGTVDKWFWDFGNGKTSTLKNPKHIYTQPGFYLVSLAVRNSINNCVDYYADFIQVGAADCAADFSHSVTNTLTNTVKFTNKSMGNVSEYFWYFDDGTFSTEKNPVHTYDNPGLYFVSLTVTDASGICFDFRMKEVQVGSVDCDATFTVYVDSLNNDAYFTNKGISANTDYYWMFGDGSFHIGPNPVHNYVAPGYFTVSLNTFNTSNGCMDNFEKVVLIGNSDNDVEANFFYQSDFETGDVSFFNESMGENLSFIWDFGDGTTSTEVNPVHNYNKGGYQFVCLTATNSLSGAIKTTCKLVQTSNKQETNCLAQFNYNIDTAELEVSFIDKSYGDPDIFAWNFGDGNISATADPVHTYANADFYLVELYTFNTVTGCESYQYEYINVGVDNDSIQAAFTYKVDTTTKGKPGGKPVDIIGTKLGGGSTLSWSYGDNKVETGKVTSTTLRPTHVYENPGLYNCCLTIEDPVINQSDTYCSKIMIPYETAVSESICEGEAFNFFGSDLTDAGEYEHTTTTNDGVDSTIFLTLTVNPLPEKPTVTLSGTTLSSNAAAGNQWYRNGTIINGANGQTYEATENGDYTVIVTDANTCSSEASDAVTVNLSGIDEIEPFGIEIYPNPMQSYTKINYVLTNTAQINITLFDAAGNKVETLVNTYKPAGNHEIIWREPGLSNGIYYLVFKTDKEMTTRKLVIQR